MRDSGAVLGCQSGDDDPTMKLVYLGSPEAAVPPLRALVDAGHEMMLVVSQPDRRRGRGSALSPSPVKAAALELGLPTTDDVAAVLDAAARGAELGVIVAYGKLIRPHLLRALPFLNIHFSLLPRWRGAAPVERALLAGDTETGVCLMGLEEGLDTGPVFRRVVTPIDPDEPVSALRDRLVTIGTEVLVDALRDGFASLGSPEPQSGNVTHAAKLEPAEFRIEWARPTTELHRLIRLGLAWTTFRGKRLKVLAASPVRAGAPPDGAPLDAVPGSVVVGTCVATGDGWLELTTVQPEGKSPMNVAAWRNGFHPGSDEVLGVSST